MHGEASRKADYIFEIILHDQFAPSLSIMQAAGQVWVGQSANCVINISRLLVPRKPLCMPQSSHLLLASEMQCSDSKEIHLPANAKPGSTETAQEKH